MFVIIKGLGLLIFTLVLFSLFSLKAPKGDKAMSGLANAAVATFLIEAIHRYIGGNFLGLKFIGEVGVTSGSLSGPAAAILVGLSIGINPVYAVATGVAVGGLGILPGFIAGYIISLIAPILEKKLPEGINIIFGALILAPLARFIAVGVNPLVNATLLSVGSVISVAAEQSPIGTSLQQDHKSLGNISQSMLYISMHKSAQSASACGASQLHSLPQDKA